MKRQHDTQADLKYVRRAIDLIRNFHGDDKDLEYDLLLSFQEKEDIDFESNVIVTSKRIIH